MGDADASCDPDERVAQLLARFDGRVCTADLVCDHRNPASIAYRIVAPDLTVTNLTYGELRALSERYAATFASLGVGPGDRVAIDLTQSPFACFEGYHGQADKSAEKFSPDGRWYCTGDVGHVDEEGYVFFSSRDDDVIIMAGYRIGPFEAESVMSSHSDVVESAAIAVPDAICGEIMEAYVVLRSGAKGSTELATEIQ
ncbi:MAG: AMP-binding protein [Novosphingobium sp.]|nr:AMP-binding protein [Novosphingobium sp.]